MFNLWWYCVVLNFDNPCLSLVATQIQWWVLTVLFLPLAGTFLRIWPVRILDSMVCHCVWGIALAVYSSLICCWTHPRDWLHVSSHGHESFTQRHRIDATCLGAKLLPYAKAKLLPGPSCYCPLVAKSHWPNDTALTLAVNVKHCGPMLDHLQAILGYLPFYLWNSKISAWRWLHHLQAEVDLVSTSLSQQLVKAINTFGFISIDNG